MTCEPNWSSLYMHVYHFKDCFYYQLPSLEEKKTDQHLFWGFKVDKNVKQCMYSFHTYITVHIWNERIVCIHDCTPLNFSFINNREAIRRLYKKYEWIDLYKFTFGSGYFFLSMADLSIRTGFVVHTRP